MIRSMTAFQRCEAQLEGEGRLVWEVRSVNHRYLDVVVRMPEDFRGLEVAIREKVSKRLSRGKVECNLKFSADENATIDFSLNKGYAEKVISACQELESMMENPAPTTAINLLKYPGVVSREERDMGPLLEQTMALLDEALTGLVSVREGEGDRLKTMIEERCIKLAELVEIAKTRRPEVVALQREKLKSKLSDLQNDANVDEGRIEQEMVIMAQRLDVDEELSRLESHLKEAQTVLKKKEPVGRRLDFLMQEFNREANTLSSKSSDAETTSAAIDMKVLIEQMREQVQNIE